MANSTVILQFIPGETKVVSFQSPSTVGKILDAAGVVASEWKPQIGGRDVTNSATVDGNTTAIRLIKSKVKGNSDPFTLIVQFIPGETKVVNLTAPVTLRQAVQSIGVDISLWKPQINGREVSWETSVDANTTAVRLVKAKVKGN